MNSCCKNKKNYFKFVIFHVLFFNFIKSFVDLQTQKSNFVNLAQ